MPVRNNSERVEPDHQPAVWAVYLPKLAPIGRFGSVTANDHCRDRCLFRSTSCVSGSGHSFAPSGFGSDFLHVSFPAGSKSQEPSTGAPIASNRPERIIEKVVDAAVSR